MPIIRRWFDSEKNISWEKSSESPWKEIQGTPFYTYPLSWLLPYVEVSKEDLRDAPSPLWITDIAPGSPIGNACEEEEGTFIIDLPASYEDYLKLLSSKTRKKFRTIARNNEDLEIKENSNEDIDALWQYYVDRLQTLATKAGGEHYTPDELAIRREFYQGSKIRTLSFYHQNELLAVNVSFWESDTVFDLACLIKPTDSALDRSLGTLAILKNIELAINQGRKFYDLLSRDYGYKRSYGAREYKMRAVIVCSKEFAREYQIPFSLIMEIID